jgi:hypothetical protein
MNEVLRNVQETQRPWSKVQTWASMEKLYDAEEACEEAEFFLKKRDDLQVHLYWHYFFVSASECTLSFKLISSVPVHEHVSGVLFFVHNSPILMYVIEPCKGQCDLSFPME